MVYATMSPTAPVFGLRREIDRLFEDAFRLGHAGRGDWSPAVDVRELDQELLFTIEVPGVAQSDVEVTTENGVLTVRGQRAQEQSEGEEGRYHLAERGYGSFVRRFQLPQGVKNEEIQADVENGLLTVRVRKAALPEAKQIHITAGTNPTKHTQKVLADVGRPVETPTKASKALQAK
jgi:HSP20 family protein